MTAKELYEELKAAADYLGVGFHGMDKVKVWIQDGDLVLALGDHEIHIGEEAFKDEE
jgi:hypothetical protein